MREPANRLRLAGEQPAGERLGEAERLACLIRDRQRRLRGRVGAKLRDRELAELRSIRRARNGRRPPAVLALGDSAMFFVPREDEDARRLDEMVRHALAERPKFLTVAGPGYNPRIFAPYLLAIERASWRPDAVLLTVTAATLMDLRLAHPTGGYQNAGEQLRDLVERGGKSRRLARPSAEIEEAYDRRLAASLVGPGRPIAEVRLLTNASPKTPRQQSLRADLLLDAYLAQRLEPTSCGPALLRSLGSDLARMRLPTLLCVAPMNHEQASSSFGEATADHIRHNSETLAAEFRAGAGRYGAVLDATFLCPADEFSEVHLNDRGRRRLAARIAPALVDIAERGRP